ncbi:TonB-dependent receptor [Echinimonas agarilytica]|uniref:TonB-dependent receptor n=1 Tax=Echinimonas agarilytica TaxID=1215918 RepID=A0AA41W3I7_9GAMM|nr:TonB-dependent receptor [Echinimonas agarilytica]MCM2678156.1 TonB-dependent receptor [Echinimonas agarilytica]
MFRKSILATHIKLSLLASITAISPVAMNVALAEESSTKTQKEEIAQKLSDVETIQVTGIRGSLSGSQFLKRSADQVMDAITAEDIGKLPDQNVAEALQRITGVQIGRDATGAGSGFQVRGISQNRVEINGQTMVSNNGESRSNSFNDTSSSLFKGIEVIKSPTADMTEGAIGATVRLKTFAPLDFKKDLTLSGKYEGTKDQKADDKGYSGNALLSQKFDWGDWGEFGYLVNFSREEKITESELYSTNWRAADSNQLVLDPDSPEKITPGTLVYIPDQPRLERKPFEEKKTGLDSKIQWAPSADLEFFAHAFKTKFTQNLKQVRMNYLSRDTSALLQDNAEYLTFERGAIPVQYSDDQGSPATENAHRAILSYGEFDFDAAGSPARFAGNFSRNDIEQFAFSTGAKWSITEDLASEYVFNRSSSKRFEEARSTSYNIDLKYEILDDEGLPTDEYVRPSMVMNNGGGGVPNIYLDYSNFGDDFDINSYDDMQVYAWNNFSGSNRRKDAEEVSHQLDFDYFLDYEMFTTVEFGARYSSREVSRTEEKMINSGITGNGATFDQILGGEHPDGLAANNFEAMEYYAPGVVTNFFEPMEGSILGGAGGSGGTSWLIPRYDRKVWNSYMDYLVPGQAFEESQTYPYDITEDVTAAYLKLNYDFDLFDFPVSGNFGLRYVETDTTSIGNQSPDNGDTFEQTTIKNTYSNTLPSFNANVRLNDDMYLRVAYAQTMSRPDPVDLSPSVQVYSGTATGQRGNPYLKPFEASQMDLSYEWYIDDVSSFSSAIFYKDIENFHKKTTILWQGSDHGIDLDNDGLPDDITLSTKVNGGGGTVQGLELAYQSVFDFLPGWMSGFGAQLNYTYTDSDQDSGYDELTGNQLPVPDLSENSYNIVLFYEKYGFSFRAAYNYRDERYIKETAGATDSSLWVYDEVKSIEAGSDQYSNLSAPLSQWRDEYETLDLSANYKINSNMSLHFQATNVLDEERRDYAGVKDITTEYLETGRFFRFGVSARY